MGELFPFACLLRQQSEPQGDRARGEPDSAAHQMISANHSTPFVDVDNLRPSQKDPEIAPIGPNPNAGCYEGGDGTNDTPIHHPIESTWVSQTGMLLEQAQCITMESKKCNQHGMILPLQNGSGASNDPSWTQRHDEMRPGFDRAASHENTS